MATDIHCEGHEDTLKIYLGMHQVLFMERDTTRVAEFYAPEVISHNRDEGGSGVTKATHETLKAMWENSKARDPDRVLINDLILCAGDFVIARVRMKGSPMVTPLGASAPERRSFEASAIDIYRFENGRVVERWGNNDTVSILRQLGRWPAELD